MRLTPMRFCLAIVGGLASALASSALALPALQLGPTTNAAPDWSYNTTTATWDYTGSAASTAYLSAFANATKANGGSGSYAWDAAGAANQYAYLVVAGAPGLGNIGDIFDITVNGATLFDSGFGNPPEEDSNSLAPHGIYDTYFEIYRFAFGGLTDIYNTEPPGGDSAKGYKEDFAITINSLAVNLTALHFDLFTTTGDGSYSPGQADNKKLVGAFAPFSHDAQWNPGPGPDPEPDPVPVPGTALLLGLGLLGLRLVRRKVQ